MNDFSAEWSWSLRAADYAPRTIKDHTGFASAFVAWLDHEGIALDRATRGDAERWLVSLASVHQRRKAVYALKAFARWCAEENISDDFGIRLRAPKCPSPPQKVASGEEVEALLAACRGRGFEVARDHWIPAVVEVLGELGVDAGVVHRDGEPMSPDKARVRDGVIRAFGDFYREKAPDFPSEVHEAEQTPPDDLEALVILSRLPLR